MRRPIQALNKAEWRAAYEIEMPNQVIERIPQWRGCEAWGIEVDVRPCCKLRLPADGGLSKETD